MTTGIDTDSLAPHSAIAAGPTAALRQGIVLEEKIRNGSPKQRLRRWAFRVPPEQRGRSLAGRGARGGGVVGGLPYPRPQPHDDSGSRARVPDGRRLPTCRKLCEDNS